MKKVIISLIAAVGSVFAASAVNGCLMIWVDEPTMPKSMLNR